MLSARHHLFEAGFRAIAATGADRWLAPLARGRGLVLTFHHVRPEPVPAFAPNRLLTITPAFLDATLRALASRGIAVVPLDALPERLAASEGPPFAVLTFDDGYRDNLEHAWPVLRRHGVPWTLFVTSDFAEGRGRLWWIELERAVARLDRVRLRLGEAALDLPAGTPAEKTRAFSVVYAALRGGPEARLLDAVAELCRAAGFAPGTLARELCLGWDDLRRLARQDPAVSFGAHTCSHPMLAKHDAATAEREMAQSRARIAAELGRPVRHLAYPVGDPTSAGPRDFALARALGFETAVTTRPGHLFAGHAQHLHALPRVSVNGCHQSRAALRGLLSGVPFLAWNRGRRLNVG